MIIYPAIDIRAGQCVRLYQGDYAKETVYQDKPIDAAKQFLDKGAAWLHLVDLDGAKNPDDNQASLINELLRRIPVNIQVGGGIRTEAQIDAYFAAGAGRVVIGSLACTSPERVEAWLKQYGPERIVLAFDVAFDGDTPMVMTQAWQNVTDIALFDIVARFAASGAQHILCTDISCDGALSGPNMNLYRQMTAQFPELNIQASGGISQLDDLRRLKRINVSGAIMGRALYEKKFDLSEALSC
ncbi:1-(5-phosphoribosyl)-5-[(5-phosphoribosylamino)methylideneamino]imidazole-4-carboxamide isomerase [Legionella sp. CNM-4043-24]|uniref:1-(5-phosphoribosyl)-5-[(5- phosphoribosylamino)methylideneamino]imidazole-4- carboxamide isomerase n=1 Tax=Legionella sp. CNM-4043-24 TaxID=3421646 RepID=UPI00403B1679